MSRSSPTLPLFKTEANVRYDHNKTNQAHMPNEPYGKYECATALVAHSLEARTKRLEVADMISTDEAAALAGVRRAAVNDWIKKGRAIGLSQTKRGFRLPRWQFDLPMWDLLPKLSATLGVTEGWALLAFLETPLGALEGRTPRQAIEQGDGEHVLLLAEHKGEA